MKLPHLSLADFLYIGLGGILGSLLRTWIGAGFEGRFPAPTIILNILGACALAVLYGHEHHLHPKGRYLYMVGFCGSFTTVSLFSLETIQLLASEGPLYALLNIALPIALSVGLALFIIPIAEKRAERFRK